MSKESYVLGLGREGLTGFSISLSLWGKQKQMDEPDMGVGAGQRQLGHLYQVNTWPAP